MQIIESIKEMQLVSRKSQSEGKTIGFVPTMGSLHEGHLSLVNRSKIENDITVVSIFVNPTQFGPEEDFEEYPRDTERDLQKLKLVGVNAVFIPDRSDMYPEGASISVTVGSIGEILCGTSRPGHFNGVATVVTKLFNIVGPHRAYFGQKDFQQSVIIRKLVEDLNLETKIIVCPIVREPDGLAMSSRNAYLTDMERKASAVLFRALKLGKEQILQENNNDISLIRHQMENLIRSEPLVKIDYIEIVHPETLTSFQRITIPVAICIAAYIGNTRLIDTIIVDSRK